jgi:Protein of unknown function (DUF3738)
MELFGGGGLMAFSAAFPVDEPTVPGTAMSFASAADLSVSGTATVELVRDMLEQLHRLVVDETSAEGSFELDLHDISGVEHLVAVLREQLGIVTTPSRRDVRMLVVRPANQV